MKHLKRAPDEDEDEDDEEGRYEAAKEAVNSTLGKICDIARKAASDGTLAARDLQSLLQKASELEHSVVDLTYSTTEGHIHDFIPVYCGNDVKDAATGNPMRIGVSATLELMTMLQSFSDRPAAKSPEEMKKEMKRIMQEVGGDHQRPYSPSSKPSPQSTPLARFRANLPTIPPNAPPARRAFAEARCEVMEETIAVPMRMQVTDNVLAVLGAGGWKNRDPSLQLFKLGAIGAEGDHHFNDRILSIKIGLCDIARTMQLDDARSLVYVGDGDRVKSYRWTMGSNGKKKKLAACPYVEILRAGEKGIAIWDVDGLPTHGPKGKKTIGKEMDPEYLDSWRDNDGDEIELSRGSKPTLSVESADLANIGSWAEHPNDQNKMVVASEKLYKVSAVDLETQQTVSRYLGHGAYDVRAKAPLYELSTGNNYGVNALAWDGQRNALYAGTECSYIDRMGRTFGYCRGEFPKPKRGTKRARPTDDEDEEMEDQADDSDEEEEGEDDEDDEDDYDPDSGDGNWPDRAFHDESSFGFPLDSADHRVYEYKFKLDSNPDILPASGYSRLDSDPYGW
ncbi:hypothetical protein BV25DRAFT_1993944 [Artomyces pyxidatus]|uniref:Uncharacterized protein n=1 Tax=Artomyces pyxidatus TaxID=48021 RepID=A0ACB8SSI3_9AGAM|nr:hypothetical protein BV25DRAFT_1993944 [Artomyces pyxidatus]